MVEMRDELAADTTFMHYRSMFQAAWEAIPSFHYVLNATAKEITADHVTYTDADGVDHELPADSVVLSVGMRAKKRRGTGLLRRGQAVLHGGRLQKARHHPDHQPQRVRDLHGDLIRVNPHILNLTA